MFFTTYFRLVPAVLALIMLAITNASPIVHDALGFTNATGLDLDADASARCKICVFTNLPEPDMLKCN